MGKMAVALSETIRELRHKHGLTQVELADLAAVSLPSLSRLERGKETIRLDVLTKVAESLGYRIVLLPEKNDPKDEK